MAILRLLVSVLAVFFLWNSGIAANEPTASEKAAMATVEKVHADWREVDRSEGFKEWLSKQTKETRDLGSGWDASGIIRLLNLYKADQRKIPGPGTFADGLTAYNRGDHSRAFSVFLSLAAGGNANAQYNVGLMYDRGLGVPKEERPAMFWYRKAAEQGDADAQFSVGAMYDMGRGVPKDDQQAMSWYRKAAEQGRANAQLNLGLMYSTGQGVPKDDQQAMSWYRKAAEQGRADAQFNLGLMYDMGQGVPKDDQQAMSWYRKAAEQGRADAQFNLGLMYSTGQGVPKDDQLAYFWWLLASVRGDTDAVKARDRVESRITPEQRAAAQAKARDWKPKSGK